jgi:transcriptional regulator with XRE-family HTH domain
VITGSQIRAGRALLNWSAAELAAQVGSTRQTILRLEQHDGIPPSRSQTLIDLQRAFEAAGVEFIGTPEDGPGVRLWKKKS